MTEAAGNIRIGTAYLDVETKTDKNAKNKLENELGGVGTAAGDKFNQYFGKALGKMTKVLGTLQIGKMIGDVIASSIQSYANYEQLVGGVDTLFKNSSKMVQEYAAQAYKNQGISANQYMETVTSFSGALLRTLGDDTDKAAELANMAIGDMADQANKYGTTVESVKNTYLSLARGGYAMLDNLFGGMFAGTKQGLRDMLDYAERYRASLGETVSYSEDSYADIVSAIHDVSVSLGVYGTTAEEAAGTISGAFNMFKASWENLLTALADPEADFSLIFGQMCESATTLLSNAIPVLGKLLGEMIVKLPEAIEQLAPILLDAIVRLVLKVGETFMNGLDKIFTDFGNWVAKLVNGTEDAGDQMAQATGEGVDEAVAEVKRLPSETDAALQGLDYSSSGYAIGHSFAQGILGRIGEVASAASQLAAAAADYMPHSPAKKGPFSGQGWTLYSGEATADAFAEGFTRRMAAVQAQIAAGMGRIAATIDGSTNNYNVSMNVTADSTTTLDSLIAQAQRAKYAYR